MNNFWDERYSVDEYVYGTEPNEFFKQELQKLQPGKILLPGEGEGRNAVFAARNGWKVIAFDTSTEGKKKADKLARAHHVEIDYQISSYEDIQLKENQFDVIALVFTHMPAAKRTAYHQKLLTFLKPGGTVILEGFSKEQINNTTGGPRDINMLFSNEELLHDFSELSTIEIIEIEVEIKEGLFHDGQASVIRLTGTK